MSALSKLRKTVTAQLSQGGKAALSQIGAALSRADELGGEARDAIVEWAETSETAGKVRDAVQRTRDKFAAVKPAPAPEPEREAIKIEDLKAPPSLGDAQIPVQLFGQQSCPWTGRAMRLLEDRAVEFSLMDLDEEGGEMVASQLLIETGQKTVPYIYVRGDFVGGFNVLSELDRLGQLEARIEEADESASRIKIEVAKRENTDEVAPGETSRPEDDAPIEPN